MKIIRWLRKQLDGYCPNCGKIGAWKERTDTGLLLEFNHIWMECSACGYSEPKTDLGW